MKQLQLWVTKALACWGTWGDSVQCTTGWARGMGKKVGYWLPHSHLLMTEGCTWNVNSVLQATLNTSWKGILRKIRQCSLLDAVGIYIPDAKGQVDMGGPSTVTEPFSHLFLINITILERLSMTAKFKDTYSSFLWLVPFFVSPYHNCSLRICFFSYIFSVFVPRLHV